jgi:cell division septal protein FtsQ
MRLNDRSRSKARFYFYFLSFIFILVTGIYFIFTLKINKFIFAGDTTYLDMDEVKIISLNLLKDQNLFSYNKDEFEKQLKSANPQVDSVSYSISSQDTLQLSFKIKDQCCVVVDLDTNKYLIDTSGNVTKKLSSTKSYNNEIILDQKISVDNKLNPTNVLKMNEIKNLFKAENIEVTSFMLDKNNIYIKINNTIQVIIDERFETKNLIQKYKNLTSYLEQNQKNYSIVDFRFEKVIVK